MLNCHNLCYMLVLRYVKIVSICVRYNSLEIFYNCPEHCHVSVFKYAKIGIIFIKIPNSCHIHNWHNLQ